MVVDMLESTFDKFLEAYRRFHGSGEGAASMFPDHFHCRYLEIYEQDDHCGTHLFQLKVCVGLGLLTLPGLVPCAGVYIPPVHIPPSEPGGHGGVGSVTKERDLQVQLQR